MPEYWGVRTKKQEEFLLPLTLMTHSHKKLTPIATNLSSVILEVLFPKEGIYLPGDTTMVHLTGNQNYQLPGLYTPAK